MRRCSITRDEIIEKRDTPQGSATIISKYKEKQLEVNIYEVQQGFILYFQHPKLEGAIKTYWILSGKIDAINENQVREQGDMIVLTKEDEPYVWEAIEFTKVLVHSINDESFINTDGNFNRIHQVMKKIQEKDLYTVDHSVSVSRLVEKMGIKLGYTGQKMLNLLIAAQYHDIGKIDTPDEILNKPARLTEEEFEIMKLHVSNGESLILESFSQAVYDIIIEHHERYDGSGYPKGLKAHEICQEARIIGICDSYDAMVSLRVYKQGKSKEEALDEIKALSGILYDPELVEVFLSLF